MSNVKQYNVVVGGNLLTVETGKLANLAGSAVLATGEACIVLNPPDLFAGALAQIRAVSSAGTAVAALAIKNN